MLISKDNKNTTLNDEIRKFLYDTAKNYTSTNFFKKHIQIDNDPSRTASSETSFILSGPPSLEGYLDSSIPKKSDLLQLIGGVPQLSQSEQLQTQPFGELGSRLVRFIPGGTNYQLQLGRLYTKHSNIKFPMYKWLFTLALRKNIQAIHFAFPPSSKESHNNKYPFIKDFSGLESELYNIPFGLIIVRCTSIGEFISSDYCEMCMIANVGASYSSDGVSVVENLALQVSSIVPFMSSSNTSSDEVTNGSLNGITLTDVDPNYTFFS